MAQVLTSHEYAKKLQQLADFLLSKPNFNTDWEEKYSYVTFNYYAKKADFLDAARSLGSGKKEWSDDRLKFVPNGTDMLKIYVSRSAVCRKVQEEKWECEPLLSAEEEERVGA